jgi:formylglycine-generating enzyme required for sulfatase activity
MASGLPQAKTITETLPKSSVKLSLVQVPGGTLKSGGKTVSIKPFFIARTETTWEAFDSFLDSGEPSRAYDQTDYAPDAIARPSKSYILPDLGWGHHGYPAINISSLSAQMFCRWLSSVTKKKYRLPTEAEWEWACLGGASAWKPDAASADRFAWYKGNSRNRTHPVGKKAPNGYGLHDMYGNVGEWATDAGGKPVLCGGTFQDDLGLLTPQRRQHWSPKWQQSDPQIPKSRWWLSNGSVVGFRIVREL